MSENVQNISRHSVVMYAEAIYVFGGIDHNNNPISELYWWGGHGWNPGGSLFIQRFGHRTINTSLNEHFHVGGVGRKPIQKGENTSKLILEDYAWYPEVFSVQTSEFLSCV
mgnify:CR=1 FL=1